MLRLSLVLMMFMGSPVQADFHNGNTLLALCNDNGSDLLWGACSGYVEAVTDVLSHGAIIAGGKTCTPENATSSQVRDIVVRFLVNHPEERHFSAESLVTKALFEAFPCT